jgi:hypothetical protein
LCIKPSRIKKIKGKFEKINFGVEEKSVKFTDAKSMMLYPN